MLKFNGSGLLVPNSNISSSLGELKSEFVDNQHTAKRKAHFDAYVKYSNALKQLCGNIDLIQWIDGSFVTRAPNPNDIDVVTFVDSLIVVSLGNALKPFKFSASENVYQVDGYIVAVHSASSKQYHQYQNDKAYWNDQFSKTRRNRAGNKLSKGFLEIVY